MNWQDFEQATVDEIMAWAEQQPWCSAMANCVQDAEWHAEGDVWTHTRMVCGQLVALAEWSDLTTRERTILLFTALFHDAAKPLTSQTDPTTGRVTSPKHAVRGEQLARHALRELGCDLATREAIAGLVRYHGRPAFLSERTQPAHEVIRMSWLVNNRLLYLFAIADTRGRTTDSMSRPEENLHYWKMQAEELGCFDSPYAFSSDHARFHFFRQRDADLHYVPHADFSCDAILLCGLPGSGKDTWLHRQRPDLPVVSLDEIRQELRIAPTENQGVVVQAARERCRAHLRAGESFALNATNVVKQTRSRWLDLFADYRARIKLVYVEPPWERLVRQNRQRSSPVPDSVLQKLAAKCEPPTWAECHHLTMVDA